MNVPEVLLGRPQIVWMVAALMIGLAWTAADGISAETPAETTKAKTKSVVGRKVSNFILPDTNGKQVALSDYGEKRVVVLFFMGTQCPISNLYLTELGKL